MPPRNVLKRQFCASVCARMKLPIRDEEWDFDRIPINRLNEAFVYEYCRSEARITDAIGACPMAVVEADTDIPEGNIHVRKRRIDINKARCEWKRQAATSNADARGLGAESPLSLRRPKTVYEIFIRRGGPDRPRNPFIHYDCNIILSAKFPLQPYTTDPAGFGLIKLREAIALPAVYDLKSCAVWVRIPRDHPFRNHINSKFSHKIQWVVSEPNGASIELSKNDPVWRRFAVAIDFSRPDMEVCADFARFIKDARSVYKLPACKKSERLTRGVPQVPLWLSDRFCQDSLDALSAHRLVQACGNAKAALQFRAERLQSLKAVRERWTANYKSPKEFLRAAARYTAVSKKLFGER